MYLKWVNMQFSKKHSICKRKNEKNNHFVLAVTKHLQEKKMKKKKICTSCNEAFAREKMKKKPSNNF